MSVHTQHIDTTHKSHMGVDTRFGMQGPGMAGGRHRYDSRILSVLHSFATFLYAPHRRLTRVSIKFVFIFSHSFHISLFCSV
jgi:hypothetical protein